MKKIDIDMWDGRKCEKGKYEANAFFTPGNSTYGYSGWIYENGEIIGDYLATDSEIASEWFNIEWND